MSLSLDLAANAYEFHVNVVNIDLTLWLAMGMMRVLNLL